MGFSGTGGLWVNPLVPVVRPLPYTGRQAMYAAANAGLLRRGTWNGCAFNRAGTQLGQLVTSAGEAALVLGTTVPVVRRFIRVWDGLRGSEERCTQLLREALEEVGLVPPAPAPGAQDGQDVERARSAALTDA
ncbi:MAG: hypothetical protein M3133_04720 [Actinomycetota bacterium]|nr:hypothetical protein [Actinomycetota bacterium]